MSNRLYGYTITPPSIPFLIRLSAKRDERFQIEFRDSSNMKSVNLTGATVTLTARSAPNDPTAIVTKTLSAVTIASGIMRVDFAPADFDALSWDVGEAQQCLFFDLNVLIGSLDYPVTDGTGKHVFKLYVDQSMKDAPS